MLEAHGINAFTLLARHARGDWGDVCAEDAQANDKSLMQGTRVLSVYFLIPDVDESRIWIITEGDRSATTLLLPTEY